MVEDIDIRLLWAQRDELPPGAWDHARLANDFWRLYQNDAGGGWLILQLPPAEGLQPRVIHLDAPM